MDYKLSKLGGVIRTSDGVNIPECADNRDWVMYQHWLSEGNEPEPAMTLDEVKAGQVSLIAAAYAKAIQNNVSYTSVGGITAEYQADESSQYEVQASINGCLKSQSVPDGFAWIAADNTPVPFAYQDLLGLAEAMYAPAYAAFVKMQTLKAQINVAETEEEIKSITWETK